MATCTQAHLDLWLTDHTQSHLIDKRPWLTVFHLPAYAPELNPVETV
ncbi:hypothetical protein AB0I81_62585 [Nonomuraea sp. NPDC050404]